MSEIFVFRKVSFLDDEEECLKMYLNHPVSLSAQYWILGQRSLIESSHESRGIS